jgi:hypothetical protein
LRKIPVAETCAALSRSGASSKPRHAGQQHAAGRVQSEGASAGVESAAAHAEPVLQRLHAPDGVEPALVDRYQLEHAVVGEELGLRLADVGDVVAIQATLRHGLAQDEPLGFRQRDAPNRLRHGGESCFVERDRESALDELPRHPPHELRYFLGPGRIERPRQGDPVELGRDGEIGTGEHHRLPRRLAERELLQAAHDRGVGERRLHVEEDEHGRVSELAREPEGLGDVGGRRLWWHAVPREAPCHGPRPQRHVGVSGRAAEDAEEPHLVVDADRQQRMA